MPDGLTPAQRRLVNAHRRSLTRLRGATANQVRDEFDRLGDYHEQSVGRFVERAVPIVERSQGLAARLRASFVARAIGVAVPAIAMKAVTGASVRNGTPPETVYTRPFSQLWQGLADGKPFSQALAESSQRAGNLADTDVMLASRQATVEAGREITDSRRTSARVRAWQRVPDDVACEFCLLASTQRYKMEDLMPLHDHCTCETLPLEDSGEQVINPDLLYRLRAESVTVKRENGELYVYSEAATPNTNWEGRVSPDVKAAVDAQAKDVPADAPAPAVAIREHGELGPVLVDPRHHFTGPDDISD